MKTNKNKIEIINTIKHDSFQESFFTYLKNNTK